MACRSSSGGPCRCGGIGRHAVLRGQWEQSRASSSLAIGTMTIRFGLRVELGDHRDQVESKF